MPKYGFIHDKLDIKILILFVLKRLPCPIDSATLCDLVNCDDGIDYFDYSDCLAELVKTEHINEIEEYFEITEKGKRNADSVESSLPFSVRNKAERNIKPVAERLKRMAMITAKHSIKDDNSICVSLAMEDGKGEIFSSSILVPDENTAIRIEKRFRIHAEEIYSEYIKLLTE